MNFKKKSRNFIGKYFKIDELSVDIFVGVLLFSDAMTEETLSWSVLDTDRKSSLGKRKGLNCERLLSRKPPGISPLNLTVLL